MLIVAVMVAVGAGLVWGRPVARYAALRTTRQPLEFDIAAEQAVLGAVLDDPRQYPKVSPLTVADFARDAHARAWEAIVAHCQDVALPTGQEDNLEDLLATAGDAVPPGLRLVVEDTIGVEAVQALIAVKAENEDALLKAGETVMNAGIERTMFMGERQIVAGDVDAGEPDLLRRFVEPTARRLLTTRLLLAVSLLAAIVLPAFAGYDNVLAKTLAAAGLAILAIGGVVWALVDTDTLYIDLRTFWPACAASWLLVCLAAVADHDPSRLISGVVAAGFTVAVFEGSNLLYRLVRGMHGLGGGDSLLALATVGVPAAVTGNWMMGYFIIMASLLLAVGGWMVRRVRSGEGRQVPFAFGPYLATGWIAAALGTVVFTAVT